MGRHERTGEEAGLMLMLLSPESRVPADHPLREVKKLTDAALRELSSRFHAMYIIVGCPSIPPERLLRSTLLMAFYSIRSERQFCEQLDSNLLFSLVPRHGHGRRDLRRLTVASEKNDNRTGITLDSASLGPFFSVRCGRESPRGRNRDD